MPYRRTVRITTRWTPEEWLQVEAAAREHGVPAARYVREAALAAKLPPRVISRARARQRAHELVRQLKRVLNNLHQLLRVAHEHDGDAEALAIESAIAASEAAVLAAAVYRGNAEALVTEVIDAGRYLNEVTHHAHTMEDLPPATELEAALRQVVEAAGQVAR